MSGIHGDVPVCARESSGVFPSLGVDGDDFSATSSHQEDAVETLQENLQELHVWEEQSQGRAACSIAPGEFKAELGYKTT